MNQPADAETKALDVLEELLGPSAISSSTIVLFTHTEELEGDEQLEDYLVTWRKDLGELVKRCGHRYHTLETHEGRGEEDKEEKERRAVEELLEKVEQLVKKSGAPYFSCRLYEEAEERVRAKQEELVKERRGEDATEEEREAVREEAERSIDDLNVDVESLFPSLSVSPSSSPPSFLWLLWEKFTGWMRRLPKVVRKEALLGAFVGLFVGGPLGGMMGAAVGSVAVEVGRRKSQKNK